ncbi:hypothetical protein GDO86_019977, partial [Hymenochirus boettgeri]
GEANAILAKAKARGDAIKVLSEALTLQNGNSAASLTVAEQYVSAFSKLAKESNTILLPTNTGDVTSMVAQAMGIYGTLTKTLPKNSPALGMVQSGGAEDKEMQS